MTTIKFHAKRFVDGSSLCYPQNPHHEYVTTTYRDITLEEASNRFKKTYGDSWIIYKEEIIRTSDAPL